MCCLAEYLRTVRSFLEKLADGRFGCRGCGYSTKFKHNLQKHVETHHVSAKVECPDCGHMYKTTFGMRRHQRLKHPELFSAASFLTA